MSPTKTGVCGRTLRVLFGVCVMLVALPVWFVAGRWYNLRCLGIMAVLVLFYTLVHFVVSRYLQHLNRWIGAVLAVTPVFLVSLLIDALRADSGCEVMALPGLIFGDRTHLACIVFSPVDALESRQELR